LKREALLTDTKNLLYCISDGTNPARSVMGNPLLGWETGWIQIRCYKIHAQIHLNLQNPDTDTDIPFFVSLVSSSGLKSKNVSKIDQLV